MDFLGGLEALMRVGVIDIGTNTVLLLIGECKGKTIIGVEHAYRLVRLGRGVDSNKRINETTFQNCLQTVVDYWNIMKRAHCDRMIVTGTSAVRDVTNRNEFMASVKSQTGLDLNVLSGDDEARWSYLGGVSSVTTDGWYAVLDIGGGSTELALGTRTSILDHASIDAGAVRITERFFTHDPPISEELEEAKAFILEKLKGLPVIEHSQTTIIGVAGTITTLASLDLGLRTYVPDQVTGHRITRRFVERTFHCLARMPTGEIKKLLAIEPGRADVITAGILILLVFMQQRDIKTIVASDRGLRYGIALRECTGTSTG